MSEQDTHPGAQPGPSQAAFDELREMVLGQNTKIENLTKENTALKSQVGTADAGDERKIPELPKETFTVEGNEYRFAVRSMRLKRAFLDRLGIKGDEVTAQDALATPVILQYLVTIGSGAIVKIDK